ncbi:MAG: GNAT family N-acetyltransferase [Alphaproteobacteria bacterium]|nr:GNAT family N-acetyltransferase [Alphaproteobacteria bacterium]
MIVLDHAIPTQPQRLRDGREVRLRRGAPEDAEARHVLQRAIVEAGQGVVLLPEEVPERPRPWDAADEDLRLFALAGERIVGEASVRRVPVRALRHNASFDMGVHPDFQGAGLGRLLAERAMAWADDNGILRIDLQVMAANARARALYASLGFVQVRWKEGFLRWPDGRVESDLTMERLATPAPERLPAGPEHAGFLRRLGLSARPELALLPPPLAEMQLDAQAASYARAWPEARSWILTDRGEPVGRLMVVDEVDHVHAIDIIIAPERRGQGLGGAAFRALQRECAARGMPLSLSVTVHNPARRLYQRLGFQELSSDGVHVRMRWSPTDDVISE